MTAIANLVHPKAGKPTTQHVYRDKDGNPVLVINRFDRKDKKFFLPYDLASEEWTAPDRSPLYRLDELVAANDNRPVIITEGEKCADALAGAGYVPDVDQLIRHQAVASRKPTFIFVCNVRVV